MIFGRTIVSAALAAIVTFGLFFLMQSLVAMEDPTLQEPPPRFTLAMVRVIEDSEIVLPPKQIERPDAPEPPPALPKPARNVSRAVDNGISIPVPEPEADLLRVGTASSVSDGAASALLRVQPEYPPRAAELALEGWVDLQFVVDELGRVCEPKVVASSHRVFEGAALRSVRRWRYEPRVRDGEHIRSGEQVRMVFRLDH